jgi:tetratricopeptide (TPR) repeat protein
VVEPPKPPVVEKKPVPMGPKAMIAKARALLEKGQTDAALELFGRVASSDPSNVEALTGRGLCYLDLENYPPAEASFEAALRLEPEDADAMLGIAQAYENQGKKAEAIAAYEKYLARHAGEDDAEVAKRALEQLRK